MDACVSLAKNVGEMRTETELLPQCWEQINHMYEERRLLVAQSLEDLATVVREAAAHNLALLLPLFHHMDKYFKVEELMFQLACDPSGVVVETTLKELLPAIINWGNKLDHILRVLLSHILGSAQRCPPLSGVEGSVESHLLVLGEQERWNLDVLLRMLAELLPFVNQKAIETCPFSSVSESNGTIFSRGHVEWSAFEWVHVDCFSCLLQLACSLPQKEDKLRNRITKFLLAVSECFGDSYLTHIMLPVFLVAIGDEADLTFFPPNVHSRIKGLRPRTAVAERLTILGILLLLLAGVLGSPEHHGMIFNILWEMVVSSNIEMKISAANILKVIVPYIDAKVASTHVLPSLIILGSDQNLNVKYASIDAFGAVAQHFKNDMIVDKIRVQMDAFLEDGSLEATIAVVRSLVIFQLTSTPVSSTDVMRRRQRANAFCEAIRALDATDLLLLVIGCTFSSQIVLCYFLVVVEKRKVQRNFGAYHFQRNFLLPTLQKDPDAQDPAHKAALEIILKESCELHSLGTETKLSLQLEDSLCKKSAIPVILLLANGNATGLHLKNFQIPMGVIGTTFRLSTANGWMLIVIVDRHHQIPTMKTRTAEAVTCDVSELSPCMAAITSPKPPTTTCCSKLKEQRPCFCQYLKNPTIKQLVDSPKAKRIASTCGVEYPQC
ncbi:putative non-specific lipid-transfer protein AKCS9 [Hibiscus syriacus]|uniref:Non-specific lipid-transfer protein AKCS9 n=1 Tax=Hibiscus syriacus TaxID=106335 RepID=A0A6A3AIF7_HIBSY|nr:putative non-specific lipid-transfer protein AKCS9 [Hibiscus syriacus]